MINIPVNIKMGRTNKKVNCNLEKIKRLDVWSVDDAIQMLVDCDSSNGSFLEIKIIVISSIKAEILKPHSSSIIDYNASLENRKFEFLSRVFLKWAIAKGFTIPEGLRNQENIKDDVFVLKEEEKEVKVIAKQLPNEMADKKTANKQMEYIFKKQSDCYRFVFDDEHGIGKQIGVTYIHFLIKNADKEFTAIELYNATRKKQIMLPCGKTKNLKSLKAKKDLYTDRVNEIIRYRDLANDDSEDFDNIVIDCQQYLDDEKEKEVSRKVNVTIDSQVHCETKKSFILDCNEHIKRCQDILNPVEDEILQLEKLDKPAKNIKNSVKNSIRDYLDKQLKKLHPKFYCHLNENLTINLNKYKYNSGKNPIPWVLE